MEEEIFISKNSNSPYTQVTELNPSRMEFHIQKEKGSAVKIEQKLLFLVIAKTNLTASIQLQLSEDSINGIAVALSKVDSIGTPVGTWNNTITFENILTTTNPVIIPFCYKWSILDNIYELTAQKFAMNIDIYIDEDL